LTAIDRHEWRRTSDLDTWVLDPRIRGTPEPGTRQPSGAQNSEVIPGSANGTQVSPALVRRHEGRGGRLQREAQLLQEDETTVAKVAEQVGISSEAASRRAFSRVVGVPSAMRGQPSASDTTS